MVLFTILLIMFVCLVAFAVFVIGVGGALFTVIFSDVIVCIALIAGLLYLLYKRKKK